ncbi:amino acid ABC transporter substrate-binding protein (PAAT family) [Amycolatopsis sulphurea]|uniref:Amino acid ABC transporter substrate-binding protein (PAAT family) n=1 Tax=Amycolatopsis sulphurea TaxID=76022 RepID=A0A2A9FGM7_9PSEU|nr:transporter substrate-binding domain-containing protein [Amycolatopsis sulphurea]PFG49660.1 amino acid ABC transporter substrate-binding protein (PAAT family) [Amycolatopsis sulphurea]
MKRFVLSIAAVLSITVLAACGDGPSSTANQPAPARLTISVPAPGQSTTIDRVKKEGVIRVGVIVSAPFILQDPVSSTWYGPAADVVASFAGTLGVKANWIGSDFDTIVAGLQADKFDIAATGLYATPARKAVVDFVNYAKSGACYAVRKDDTRVNSLADLNNPDLHVVVVSGSSFITQFPTEYPRAQVTPKPLPPGAANFYNEIKTKRFDVTPIESTLAKQVAQQQPDLKIVPDAETCLLHPDLPQDVGFAVRKGDTGFRSTLQDAATALQSQTDAGISKYSSAQ